MAANSSRWEKGNRIGAGGFGTVFVAKHKETGEEGAFKEIKILSQLEHPNIVKYLDNEIVGGRIYLYMEYIQSGSLRDYISKQGALHEPLIKNFTVQILSGLVYLHSKRVVHRDIKPGNILMDPNKNVKLADFGLAKHLEDSVGNHSVLGTYNYAAPEVFRRVEYNSSLEAYAADIWNLGCVIIEMFTGKIPWPDFEMKYPPIPEELSEEGKNFLRLCFTITPTKRPSAAQLLEEPFLQA